jgi:hypothetical protein
MHENQNGAQIQDGLQNVFVVCKKNLHYDLSAILEF